MFDALLPPGNTFNHLQDVSSPQMHFNKTMDKSESILEDSLQTSLRNDSVSDPISPAHDIQNGIQR